MKIDFTQYTCVLDSVIEKKEHFYFNMKTMQQRINCADSLFDFSWVHALNKNESYNFCSVTFQFAEKVYMRYGI